MKNASLRSIGGEFRNINHMTTLVVVDVRNNRGAVVINGKESIHALGLYQVHSVNHPRRSGFHPLVPIIHDS